MFKLQKILYPTDFSPASLEALKYAVSFAQNCRAKLILLNVVDEKVISEGLNLARVSAPEALGQEMAAEAGRRLRRLVPAEDQKGLDSEIVILNGTPFHEIVNYAKNNDVDMIVIGAQGRSGMEQFIFGSTAEKVVRRAHCPVLSVKPATAHS